MGFIRYTNLYTQEPKGFVTDGDEVEIYVEGIGSLINKMKFD